MRFAIKIVLFDQQSQNPEILSFQILTFEKLKLENRWCCC